MKLKHAESEAAKKANDTKTAAELKAWGGESQELAHRQLAGEALFSNILEVLTPALPEIARKAQVISRICCSTGSKRMRRPAR
ncbi:MAG: hypothetical protein ABSE86_17100 [Bryobacteraceae bacterium]